MHKIAHLTLFCIAALALLYGILVAVFPVRFVWSGDGVARVSDGERAADYPVAVIGTRTRMFFGLREQFSFNVQQVDLGSGRYVRFSDCVVHNSRQRNCTGSDDISYKIQVIKKPAYDQFSDDDGVNVGN